ncbi:MAG: hypothetical protein LBR26_13365 [Prevotella sp.]|jgi:hypothetical protein|nr:hypothetical protein [Prevotella sp.]
MLEHLQRLPVDILERFLELRDHKKVGISEALGNFILELNDASNLFRKYRNVGECARQLQKLYPKVSIPLCRQRVCDAINFFNTDCTVTAVAWNNYFADYMMNLADVNLMAADAHGRKEARLCAVQAHKYRVAAAANIIAPERIRFKPQIVSADVKLERMIDTSPVGILAAWKEIEEIIDARHIDQSEKDRLKLEAGRELDINKYAEFEETEDED